MDRLAGYGLIALAIVFGIRCLMVALRDLCRRTGPGAGAALGDAARADGGGVAEKAMSIALSVCGAGSLILGCLCAYWAWIVR